MMGADTVMSSIGELHKILFYMKGADTVMTSIGK
jgi:energy-converting hydrogenase Eha subunit F